MIPAVLTEERLVLGAVLKDGTRIRGQVSDVVVVIVAIVLGIHIVITNASDHCWAV